MFKVGAIFFCLHDQITVLPSRIIVFKTESYVSLWIPNKMQFWDRGKLSVKSKKNVFNSVQKSCEWGQDHIRV